MKNNDLSHDGLNPAHVAYLCTSAKFEEAAPKVICNPGASMIPLECRRATQQSLEYLGNEFHCLIFLLSWPPFIHAQAVYCL